MSTETAAALSILLTAVAAAVWYWNERIRRVPLAEFGQADVERVLRFESEAVRSKILQRGWMTSYEWTSMNKRQLAAIDAELKRRGIDASNDPNKK